MKRIIFSLLLALPFMAFSQKMVEGQVYDANTHKPLAGANITNSDNQGAVTDDQGHFKIKCAGSITVSFIGYDTYESKIDDCSKTLHIGLISSSSNLEEVEITATAGSNKTLLHQPASIVKLDEKELNQGLGIYLDDEINTNIPGVLMERRSVSGGQQINIRGYGNGVGFKGANNNFDIQGSKIYLNGIPLTDAEGVTILDDIDFASIGNVEVIKGPAGTLYGLAIAGAVNLQTVKPAKGEVSLGQRVTVGSYGLQRYTTTFSMGGQRSSVLVNYGHQESDGYMVHTASHKDFVNVVADFNPSAKEAVHTYFGYSNSYDERGGELTIDQYNNLDYSGNSRYINNNAHSAVISFRAGLSHDYTFGDHISNTTTVFASGMSNNSSSAAGWSDDHPINYGFRSSLNFDYGLGSKLNLSGVVGMEAQQQYSQSISYRMQGTAVDPNGDTVDVRDADGYNTIGDVRSNQQTKTGTSSLFTQWTLAMQKGLSVTAGVGISNMNIELNNRIYSFTSPSTYNTSYDNLVSPHVAINKVFNEKVSVYASYSKGYRAPVSGNIVISATGELNTGLKPEVGNQFEIGTKGALMNGKLNYQLALFDTKFSEKMTSVAVPDPSNPNTTLYSYLANGGGEDNKGLEVLLKYTAFQSSTAFFSSVRPFANFTYNDFKYDDFSYLSEDYSGNDVAGVPPITANVGIDANTRPGVYANVNYSYRDAMPITSDGKNMTDSFGLLNAKIGFRHTLGKHFDLDLFAGARNITGTQYYTMIFVNQLDDAYLPGPHKINYFGGVNLRYIF